MKWSFSLSLLCLVVCGCGPDLGRPKLEKVVPVTGTVLYRGEPLPSFQVVFQPKDGRRPGVGITDEQGYFELGTNGIDDGCPIGPCKVGVAFAPPPDDGLGDPIDDPRKLPQPKVKVPAKYGDPENSGIVVEVPAEGLKNTKIELE